MSNPRRSGVLDIKKKAHREHATQQLPLSPHKRFRLRDKRRRQRFVRVAVSVLVAALVFFGVAGATHLNQLTISDVAVSGTKQIQADSITSALRQQLDATGFHLFSRTSIFLYPKNALRELLEKDFPRIKDVSLARESLLANALTVTIVEREPYATWCNDDGTCFVMDERGYLYAGEGEPTKTTYRFRGGLLPDQDPIGQIFLRGRLTDIMLLLHDLAEANYGPQGITVDSDQDFTVPLTHGPFLHVSFNMTHTEVMEKLKTALTAESLKSKLSDIEYLDLRFENKVYYK